jgi:hypothetical protein
MGSSFFVRGMFDIRPLKSTMPDVRLYWLPFRKQQFRNFSRGKLRTAVSPRVTRWDKRALRSRSIFTA